MTRLFSTKIIFVLPRIFKACFVPTRCKCKCLTWSLEIVNKEDLDKLALLDLIKHMKDLGKDSSETFKYVMRLDMEEEEQCLVPKMRLAFQNGDWSYGHARC